MIDSVQPKPSVWRSNLLEPLRGYFGEVWRSSLLRWRLFHFTIIYPNTSFVSVLLYEVDVESSLSLWRILWSELSAGTFDISFMSRNVDIKMNCCGFQLFWKSHKYQRINQLLWGTSKSVCKIDWKVFQNHHNDRR